jgi:hypothetical protein
MNLRSFFGIKPKESSKVVSSMTFEQDLAIYHRIVRDIQLLPMREGTSINSVRKSAQKLLNAGKPHKAVVLNSSIKDHDSPEFKRLMMEFQEITIQMIGEHPEPTENPFKFFERIWLMEEREWVNVAQKNGITLSSNGEHHSRPVER